MITRPAKRIIPLIAFVAINVQAQISTFPYSEKFDTVTTPNLPAGWTTTTNRSASGDFFSTTTSPRSAPNSAQSTNSTIAQTLISPAFDFTGRAPNQLQFYVSRSSTHLSDVLVEASFDNGTSFPFQLGDTLRNPGTTNYIGTTVQLPDTLANEAAVKVRWRILGGAGMSAGTFRIDDISLTVFTSLDLGFQSLALSPPFPTTVSQFTLTAKMKNLGVQSASAYNVNFYLDGNNNQIAEGGEFFATQTGPPVSLNDSVTMTLNHPPLPLGSHRFMAVIALPQDEVPSNDTVSVVTTVGVAPGAVKVSEIMYGPTGDEPEWAELFNSSPDTINLRNWRISDSNVGTKTTVTAADIFLPPSGFAVIAKDAVFFTVHPEITVPVMIANFSALNNTTPDAVVLYDNRILTIDSVQYAPGWGGQGGKSLERIDTDGSSNSQANWGTSVDSSGRTPGRKNSIARLDFDVAMSSVVATTTVQNQTTAPAISFVFKNTGRQPVTVLSYSVYADTNQNSLADPFEILTSTTLNSVLAPGDSNTVLYTWPQAPPGATGVIAVVVAQNDERSSNNSGATTVSVGFPLGSVVVNEIMYAPNAPEPEWIEVYNTTPAPVNIRNWGIRDLAAATPVNITSGDFTIQPGTYLVIAHDSGFASVHPGVPFLAATLPSLSNTTSDAVVVVDFSGKTIDSVHYDITWGGQGGKSLERLDVADSSNAASNWTSSTDSTGGTPNLANSMIRFDYDLTVQQVTVTGTNIIALVKNIGRQAATTFTVSLFADANRNSLPDSGELISTTGFSGSLSFGASTQMMIGWIAAPAGENAIVLRVDFPRDQRPANNVGSAIFRKSFLPGSLIVNEIMYDPLSGQNEWIEFFNPGIAVDIGGWRFSDRPTSSGSVNTFTLTPSSRVVPAGGFVIAAAESSIFSLFPSLLSPPSNAVVLILNRSGGFSLGNDGDDIVLRDLTGALIDSVSYLPQWHNADVADTRGRSLERISPNGGANDRRNWNTAAHPSGGTPGLQNSIFTTGTSSSATLSISPNPFSPDGDGYEDFCIISYNLPQATSVIRIRVFDIRGRVIRTLADAEPSGSSGQVIWDGYETERRRARIGPHIVFIEALDSQGGTLSTAKAVVVVATKL